MKKSLYRVPAVLSLAAVLGYASGSQPARDAVGFAADQLDMALEVRRVEVGEVALNVVFAGPVDGKPVVLLHGYPEFWFAWRGPMKELAAAGFRAIAPDQRGYNASDKPSDVAAYALDRLAGDVAGLISALGYERAFLAGHDFGGTVAWWTLMLHPEKIERFVIVNKPHPRAIQDHAGNDESVSWYRTFLRIPRLPGYVGRLGNWWILTKNLRDTSLPGTFPEPAMDLYRSAWDQGGAIHSMGAWYRANARAVPPTDGFISTPGRLVLAPDDAFSPKAAARRSASYLEHGEVVELESGTHWVIQEEPEEVGRILVRTFSD